MSNDASQQYLLPTPRNLQIQQQRTPNQSSYTGIMLSAEHRQTSSQPSLASTKLSPEGREGFGFRNQLHDSKFPLNMLSLRMSEREILNDFIKCLPAFGPYYPYDTEIFSYEYTGYKMCFYSQHEAHHHLDNDIISKGLCKILTCREQRFGVTTQHSDSSQGPWQYAAVAAIVDGQGNDVYAVHAYLNVAINLEPVWDDVVRCLRGENKKVTRIYHHQISYTLTYGWQDIQSRLPFLMSPQAPAQKSNLHIQKPILINKSYAVQKPLHASTPTKAQNQRKIARPRTTLYDTPVSRGARSMAPSLAVQRQTTSFGATFSGSPYMTKASHPSASPHNHAGSPVLQSVVRSAPFPNPQSGYSNATNPTSPLVSRHSTSQNARHPICQVARPPSSYTVRPTSQAVQFPTVITAPNLPVSKKYGESPSFLLQS